MNTRENIQAELENLRSSLPAGLNGQSLSVPEGYFANLAQAVLSGAKASDAAADEETETLSPLLAGLRGQQPYTVPAGYFEANAEALQSFASEPQLLNAISKQNVYTVPDGYFDSLPQLVLQKATRPEAKVVRMTAATRWMRLAAAAVVGGALCVAGYQYANRPADKPAPETATATLAPQQLASADPVLVQEIKKVPTEEINRFVQAVQPSAPAQKAAVKEPAGEEVKTFLRDVPAAEMENFLANLPSPDEDLLETNNP